MGNQNCCECCPAKETSKKRNSKIHPSPIVPEETKSQKPYENSPTGSPENSKSDSDDPADLADFLESEFHLGHLETETNSLRALIFDMPTNVMKNATYAFMRQFVTMSFQKPCKEEDIQSTVVAIGELSGKFLSIDLSISPKGEIITSNTKFQCMFIETKLVQRRLLLVSKVPFKQLHNKSKKELLDLVDQRALGYFAFESANVYCLHHVGNFVCKTKGFNRELVSEDSFNQGWFTCIHREPSPEQIHAKFKSWTEKHGSDEQNLPHSIDLGGLDDEITLIEPYVEDLETRNIKAPKGGASYIDEIVRILYGLIITHNKCLKFL